VSPGEEHKAQFIDHIGVGDVEVVFQSRDGDIAVEL
jgi:hypothetical protein